MCMWACVSTERMRKTAYSYFKTNFSKQPYVNNFFASSSIYLEYFTRDKCFRQRHAVYIFTKKKHMMSVFILYILVVISVSLCLSHRFVQLASVCLSILRDKAYHCEDKCLFT